MKGERTYMRRRQQEEERRTTVVVREKQVDKAKGVTFEHEHFRLNHKDYKQAYWELRVLRFICLMFVKQL